MIIVSQDKELILNFENIEAIGIGNPLEDDDGMFKVLASTASDNEYTLGKYKTEERAKEVLQEITKAYQTTGICYSGQVNYNPINAIYRPIYEMPVGKVDDK